MTRCAFLALAIVSLLLNSTGLSAETAVSATDSVAFNGADPLTWSRRLADSEMARRGQSLEMGHGRARWDYSPAVLALALWHLSDATNDPVYRDFAGRAVGSFVRPDGTIEGLHLDQHSLDEINPGKVILLLAASTHDEKYNLAAKHLRDALAQQPRTSDGGFWHKQKYPEQMWLDGLYMASPFMAGYAAQYHEPDLFDDAAKQILLIDAHLYDAKTGLYWHGWDEAHKQEWADPKTGLSPNFWSRAIGWYGMSIVDVLDFMPPDHPKRQAIIGVLRHVADGIVRWQDPGTGLWWQVTDQGPRPGNYLEASGSSMFVYTLGKAVNRGYLPRERYAECARRGFAGLVSDLIKTNSDGQVSLTQVCEGAGLGYTTAKGRRRDGSFDYYVSEPIVSNDPKGTGAFIFAGIEMQDLVKSDRTAVSGETSGWQTLPAILDRIHAPSFPNRDFSIAEFGAKPGESATAAIRAAIEACSAAGGGRVIIPAGEWKTGAIRLKSGVNLHLDDKATLQFSTDPTDYPNVYSRFEGVECYNYSPLIYAFGEHDVAVTGSGTLDGQASDENWWAWKTRHEDPKALNEMGQKGVPVEQRVFGPGHFLRPAFIETYRCRNVLVESVAMVRSPMWEIHPVLSENVTVRAVRIHSHGPNNDGCDPESSRDVLIENCIFDTGDDCIAIKSGRNNDGRRVNAASENIVIRGCSMQDGHGGVVIGSEVSGDCRNVFAEDCSMDSPQLARVLRLKSNAERGGTIENVHLRRIHVGRVLEAVLTVDLLYEEGAKGSHPPMIRHISLDQVTGDHVPRVLWIQGFPAATIDDISLRDCAFKGLDAAEVISHAGRIVFDRVSVDPARRHESLNTRSGP